MATIPLAIQSPQIQQPNQWASNAVSLQALINQTRLQQQAQQANVIAQQQQQEQLKQQQIATQEQQMQLDDQQKFNQAFREANGDWDQAIEGATKLGASGVFITKAQLARAQQVAELAKASSDVLANHQTKLDQESKAMLSVLNAAPEDKANTFATQINALKATGQYKPGELPENLPTDQQLQSMVSGNKAATDIVKEAQEAQKAATDLPAQRAKAQADTERTFGGLLGNATSDAEWQAILNHVPDESRGAFAQHYSTDAAQQAKLKSISPEEALKIQSQIPLDKQEATSWLAANPTKTLADFMKYKATLVPAYNFNLQNAGVAGGAGGGAVAQALANGTMKWQDVVSARTPMSVKQQLLYEVKAIKPDFNTGDFALEQSVKKEFTSGKVADELNSYNTSIAHADLLKQAAAALQNGDVRALNSLKNAWEKQMGSPLPTNFATIANVYNHEVTNALSKGHITDKEVETGGATMPANASPAQIIGAMNAYQSLMASKKAQRQQQYEQGVQGKPVFGPPAAAPPAAAGLIYARDPQGKLHSAPAGTALPPGWKQEQAPK